MTNYKLVNFVRLFYLGLLALTSPQTWSEITLDGTMGPNGALPGPEFDISEGLGRRVGSNLYHSFGEFNLANGETANFNGTNPVENILSRVTGGNASSIDGTLRTDFVNSTPNLFLLNPAGVLFGPNASLDVQGSFHVSTADYLRLADGVRFNGLPSTQDQVLTTALPEAFGFLSDNPADISFNGSNRMVVPDGETLSIIGGDVEIKSGVLSDGAVVTSQIQAPSGRINIGSLYASGEIAFDDTGLPVSFDDQPGGMQFGKVEISESSLINVVGSGGGGLYIRGGQFILNSSNILAGITTEGQGGNIIVDVSEVNIFGQDSASSSAMSTFTFGAGSAGNVRIKASSVNLGGHVLIDSSSALGGSGPGGTVILEGRKEIHLIGPGNIVSSTTFGPGNAGTIKIITPNLNIENDDMTSPSGLITSTIGNGNAGNFDLKINNSLNLIGNSRIFSSTAFGTGNAGQIKIVSGELSIIDGATIDSSTFLSDGKGGEISISSDRSVHVSGRSSISGSVSGTGNGAKLAIKAPDLEILDGGKVFTDTVGFGTAGDIEIAADNVLVNGFAQPEDQDTNAAGSRISAASGSPSKTSDQPDSAGAGNLTITAGNLRLINGGQISTSTFGPGQGGDLTVTANDVMLDGAGLGFNSGLFTNANGRISGSGDGGTLLLSAENLNISNGAEISASTDGPGSGGAIFIGTQLDPARGFVASGTKTVRVNNGAIRAGTSGSGSASLILLNAESIELVNGSRLTSETRGEGDAGFILVGADFTLDERGLSLTSSGAVKSLYVDNSTITSESSGAGNPGFLLLNSEAIDLVNSAEITTKKTNADAFGGIFFGSDFDFARGVFGNSIIKQLRVNNALISAETSGSGPGGGIIVNAEEIDLFNGAKISSESSGTGAGGIIGFGVDFNLPDGSVPANDIVDSVELNNAAISAESSGPKAGGTIFFNSAQLTLNNNAAISSRSGGAGIAGNIVFREVENFRSNNSSVRTDAFQADGGNIEFRVGNIIELENSDINASVGEGGTGGNIDIDPRFVILDNARIIAQAGDQGIGGKIDIVSDFIFPSSDSVVSATAGPAGIDGTVNIDAPDTNISGSIAVLPESLMDASSKFSERCAARTAGSVNSFVVKGRGAVPIGPGDYAPATSFDMDLRAADFRNGADEGGYVYLSLVGRETESKVDSSVNGQIPAWQFGCGNP